MTMVSQGSRLVFERLSDGRRFEGSYGVVDNDVVWYPHDQLTDHGARWIKLRRDPIKEMLDMVSRLQWQPLDTVPKDGSVFLVIGHNEGDPDKGLHILEAYYGEYEVGVFGILPHDEPPEFTLPLVYLFGWLPINPKNDK